jgi:hypothetical protein
MDARIKELVILSSFAALGCALAVETFDTPACVHKQGGFKRSANGQHVLGADGVL